MAIELAMHLHYPMLLNMFAEGMSYKVVPIE